MNSKENRNRNMFISGVFAVALMFGILMMTQVEGRVQEDLPDLQLTLHVLTDPNIMTSTLSVKDLPLGGMLEVTTEVSMSPDGPIADAEENLNYTTFLKSPFDVFTYHYPEHLGMFEFVYISSLSEAVEILTCDILAQTQEVLKFSSDGIPVDMNIKVQCHNDK